MGSEVAGERLGIGWGLAGNCLGITVHNVSTCKPNKVLCCKGYHHTLKKSACGRSDDERLRLSLFAHYGEGSGPTTTPFFFPQYNNPATAPQRHCRGITRAMRRSAWGRARGNGRAPTSLPNVCPTLTDRPADQPTHTAQPHDTSKPDRDPDAKNMRNDVAQPTRPHVEFMIKPAVETITPDTFS